MKNYKPINIYKTGMISLTYLFIVLIFIMPMVLVVQQAFNSGFIGFLTTIVERESIASIRLSIYIMIITIVTNMVFGLFAAWLITKHSFRGKNILLSLIDIPFSVSPVVSGLLFVLVFGAQSIAGSCLVKHNIHLIFALPGMILTTVFVTLPYIVREVIPVMEASGSEAEEAAVCLGASWGHIFRKITLPSVKWGLIYGIIICGARALGEFGAVSVVSGHIRGLTTTVPLQIEMLYNEYRFTAAFSLATLLMCIAIITIVIKTVTEEKIKLNSEKIHEN